MTKHPPSQVWLAHTPGKRSIPELIEYARTLARRIEGDGE